MSEEQEILRDIKWLLILFVTLFAIWAGISTVLYTTIASDIKAYNTCESVEDDKFTACFEAAKR